MKIAVISGAGSGIGRATAVIFAEQEYQVILIGRTEGKLVQTRESLAKPERHRIVCVDVRAKARLHSEIQALSLQSVDAVIANAGVGGGNRYGDRDRWQEVIDINLTGTYNLVNECLPYLRAKQADYKHVMVVSSVLAKLGVPGYSAYCASKAGLLGLMRSWAVELAQQKILVNAICPGWVETEMAADGIQAVADLTKNTYDDALNQQMKQVPLGNMSQPEEVANLIYFLMSGQQNSITGQAIDINNGVLMP